MKDTVDAYDVAIVGLGPIGATLANLLGLCGVKVLILERDSAAYHFPRAVHFDDETMRVFQTVGLAEQVAANALVNPGMRFVDDDGKLLLDWSRPQEIGRNGWHPSFRFHQPALEDVLNKGLARFSHVTVRRRCEAFLLQDCGDHVRLRYEDMAVGEIVEAKAQHVVGCDGARSLVRRFIGSEMNDLGFHERWLVVDVQLKKPRPDLGDHSIQYCHRTHPVTYARQPGTWRRWEIRLQPGELESPITGHEQIWPLLERWINPDDAEIKRVAPYTFHSLIAQRWRLGRLWIAGDAAHQTPPFMGQGMCAGIRDAANLAWKLVLAVRGHPDEAVLDSYQSERLPNVQKYIETAVRLGGLINASDPQSALQTAISTEDGTVTMESLVSELGPGLGTGSAKGQLFGQPLLKDGTKMDDAVGYAPVLLTDDMVIEGVGLPEGLAVLTRNDSLEIERELEELGVRGVLLRPDRYILATFNDADALRDVISASMLGGLLAAF